MDIELRICTSLNKHGYYTLCLKYANGSKFEVMTIPHKHAYFAKVDLARIVSTKNDVENENDDEYDP